MSNNQLLEKFPTKRLAPFDGMPVTAEAWQKAHGYHREMQRFQTLLYHGHGIVEGLEVMASEPPSSVLVIKPGVAVDSEGRTIVVARETPFDIRNEMSGLLYLLLSHKESKARADGKHSSASDFRYIYEEFTIQVLQQMPVGPHIELARIKRQQRDSKIRNAQRSGRAGPNELDMSRRQKVEQRQTQAPTQAQVQTQVPSKPTKTVTPPSPAPPPVTSKPAVDTTQLKRLEDKQGRLESQLKELVAKQEHVLVELEKVKKQLGKGLATPAPSSDAITIGISYLGQVNQQRHQRGINFLVRGLSRHHPSRQIKIEDNVPLTHSLTRYTLVFLVGEQRFKHNNPQTNRNLYNYLRDGGTLFIESCRHQTGRGRVPADESFGSLIRALGIRQIRPIKAPHPLLEEPYLFGAPPSGFANWSKAVVQVDGGVIWSMADYGCLWAGEQSGKPASREDIRAAIEWGSNIIEYALKRRKSKAS